MNGVILLLGLIFILVGMMAGYAYYGRRKKEEDEEKRVEWIQPGPVALLRPPPPCHAANPVETPCESADPIAQFPPAVIHHTGTAKLAVMVADRETGTVYAVGKGNGSNVIVVPLQIADPIPINRPSFQAEYIVINEADRQELSRRPVQFYNVDQPHANLSSAKPEGGGRSQDVGRMHSKIQWSVREPDPLPLLPETFIDSQGCATQSIESAQMLIPSHGQMDHLCLYLPPDYPSRSFPLQAALYHNNEIIDELTAEESGRTVMSSKHFVIHAGDRVALKLANRDGHYVQVVAAVRIL